MSHIVEKKGGEWLRASATGFYRGTRVRAGEKFFGEEGDVFSWALPTGALPPPSAKGEGLLDKAIKDILPALTRQTDAELRRLADEEMSGQNRKSLVGAINDEIANRIGREGYDPEPDPLS